MKKAISYFCFALMIIVFIFDLYIAISGAIDVKNTLDELIARETGGIEYWAVGEDILLLMLGFILIVGAAISIISYKTAENRVVRTVSAVMCPSFLLPIFIAALIIMS